jgi:hypothetical protein
MGYNGCHFGCLPYRDNVENAGKMPITFIPQKKLAIKQA